MEGVAEPEAIDTVMTLGMNHPMGPLTLADFISLDTCLAIMDVLHQGLGDDKYRPCPLLRRMVAAGLHGKKNRRGSISTGNDIRINNCNLKRNRAKINPRTTAKNSMCNTLLRTQRAQLV